MKLALKIVVVLACCGVGAGRVNAITSDVYRLDMTIRGYVQTGTVTSETSGSGNNQTTNAVVTATMQSVIIKRDDLINLALGRQLGTPVAAHEELAIVHNCYLDLSRMIVFDNTTFSNLATISDLRQLGQVIGFKNSGKTARTVSEMLIHTTGNATNGLTGGQFTTEAESKLEYNTTEVGATLVTNLCSKSFSGSMVGILDTLLGATNTVFGLTNIVENGSNVVVITTNTVFEGTPFKVIVPKTTFATKGKALHILIEDE